MGVGNHPLRRVPAASQIRRLTERPGNCSRPLAYDWASPPDPTPQRPPGYRDSRLARLEAWLFLTREPLPIPRLMHLMDCQDEAELIAALEQLQQAYDVDASSWELVRIAGGYQILTRPEYHTWVARSPGLPSLSAPRLTPILLETLATIAYEQPISRATLEAIRGANAAEALRQLQEQGWIRVVGREKSLGRPPLYGTTTRFLRRFGLASLDDLPPLTTEPHPNQPTPSADPPHPPIS